MNIFSRPPHLWNDQQFQFSQKRRRLFFWVIFYTVLLLSFGYNINNRIHLVDTKIIPNGLITLSATKVQYNSGDTVQVVLKNGLTNTLYINNKCPQEPLSVYRFENNLWSRIHVTVDNSVCANQPKQIAVAPETAYTIDYSNWSQLFSTPGIYRIAALADNYNGLAFTDFDILAPPPKPITPTTQIIYKTIYTPVYVQQPVYIQVPSKSTSQTPTSTSGTGGSTGTTGTSGSTGSSGGTKRHSDD